MSQVKESSAAVAGLAGAIALESGPELGDVEVKARGYWEQVWRRFRRDKIAIAGGVMIIVLLLAAFIGAPIAAHFLGHGPNDQFYTAADAARRARRAVLATSPNGLGGTTYLHPRRRQHARPRRVPASPLRRPHLVRGGGARDDRLDLDRRRCSARWPATSAAGSTRSSPA